ncbi:hypothetical protein Agub_g10628, partial [Astrephomene gubernaculifera]
MEAYSISGLRTRGIHVARQGPLHIPQCRHISKRKCAVAAAPPDPGSTAPSEPKSAISPTPAFISSPATGNIVPFNTSPSVTAKDGTVSKAKQAPMDGNEATAQIAYAVSDVSFIYPITPSTNMGEFVDQWASEGRRNVFGNVMSVTEMESE